jgi:hypothetical protein
VYIRKDCKKLSCECCGPKKARKYRRAISERAGENNLKRFMTLTLDPKKIPNGQDSISYLRDCFSKFRVYLGRKYDGGTKVSYISIVELHKSGIAHLHVLIGVFVSQEWISESWQAVGGGRIVDIRLVDIHRVSAYLSKYVTKDLLLMVPAKKKRISTSRNIRLFPPKEKKRGWVISSSSIEYNWEYLEGVRLLDEYDNYGLKSFVFAERGHPCLNQTVQAAGYKSQLTAA